MSLERPPTALLALDSLLSLGVLQALSELGIRCPDEVSVIGFDDADWTEAVSPPLTVVSQPVYEIGAEAGRRLLARIEGDTRRALHRKLPTTFVDRASTATSSSVGDLLVVAPRRQRVVALDLEVRADALEHRGQQHG